MKNMNVLKKGFALTGVMSLFAACSVMADSANTITFRGEVTEQTCSVTVNGSAARPVVLLPTVNKSELSDPADTAGLTTFTMGVSGCTTGPSDMQLKTLFIGTNVTASGNLANTGDAQNVELQLMTDSTASMAIDLRAMQAVDGIVLRAGETAGEHDFAVQYFTPTGSATAGTVVSAVQYAISYL
nr:fimbrial protein [Atlantibacter sp.]